MALEALKAPYIVALSTENVIELDDNSKVLIVDLSILLKVENDL